MIEGRFTWIFATPNQAAIVCSMLAALGLWSWSIAVRDPIGRHRVLRLTLAVASAGATLTAIFLLAASQSRAGWLGYGAACFVLWIWRITDSWAAGGSLLLLAAAILLSHDGSERIVTVFDGTASGGRIDAWRSALCLISDYPWSGLGDGFPEVFRLWYLPDTLDNRFFTALNDTLTFAGWFGLPALAVVVAALAWLFLAAWDLRMTRGAPLLALGIAFMAVHLVMGQFQSHQWWPLPRWTGALSLAVVGVGIALALRSSRPASLWRADVAVAMATGTIAALMLLGLALISAGDSQIRTYISATGLRVAANRHDGWRGNVIIFADDEGEKRRISHGLALGLLRQDYHVAIVQDGQACVGSILNQHSDLRPSMVIGCRDSCVQAYATEDPVPIVVVEPTVLPPPSWTSGFLLVTTARNTPFAVGLAEIETLMAGNDHIACRYFETMNDEVVARAITAWAGSLTR